MVAKSDAKLRTQFGKIQKSCDSLNFIITMFWKKYVFFLSFNCEGDVKGSESLIYSAHTGKQNQIKKTWKHSEGTDGKGRT